MYLPEQHNDASLGLTGNVLQEDSCNAPSDHADAFEEYGLMRDALNKTGRHIFFSLCVCAL